MYNLDEFGLTTLWIGGSEAKPQGTWGPAAFIDRILTTTARRGPSYVCNPGVHRTGFAIGQSARVHHAGLILISLKIKRNKWIL